MARIMRTAIILATFLLGMAATACGDRETLTGPTAITPPSPNGGVRPAEVGRFSGEFTLTLTADAACDSLPIELRTRRYGTMWTVNPYWHAPETYYDIEVSGPTFLDGFDSAERFYVGVSNDAASFGVGSLQGQPAFVERLSATAYFAIGGSAAGPLSSSGSSIAAAMDGYVEYCVMKSPADAPVEGILYACAPDRAQTRVRCESNRHRLQWDR